MRAGELVLGEHVARALDETRALGDHGDRQPSRRSWPTCSTAPSALPAKLGTVVPGMRM